MRRLLVRIPKQASQEIMLKPVKMKWVNKKDLAARGNFFGLCLARLLLGVGFIIFLVGCQKAPTIAVSGDPPQEQTVHRIPLSGEINNPRSEISGLAWWGDTLILLPQYPGRFHSPMDGSLFAIPKSEILAYLDGSLKADILPIEIALDAPDLTSRVDGFEGFEAITFEGDVSFLTIESRPGAAMLGYIIQGWMDLDLDVLHLELASLQALHPQAPLDNFSDESVLVFEENVLTFYEAWGEQVNPDPFAHAFNLDLQPEPPWSLPNIEYRITDVSEVDEAGQFWAINYLYPGDIEKLEPAVDELALQFGQGASHAQSEIVERLVEFQISDGQIVRTQTPPIQLALAADGQPRNWEGIVQLDRIGFLLVTDQYPETILGFVPFP